MSEKAKIRRVPETGCMAQHTDDLSRSYEAPGDADVPTLVYCKLVCDMSTDSECVLRRKQLKTPDLVPCKNCIMKIAMDRRLC